MSQEKTLRKGKRIMLDALQAKEIAKTNFSALEKDLEQHNKYFKYISDMVRNASSQSQTSVKISYQEDPRFADIMTVLKWKGYKIKHYRCTNWQAIYYQVPEYQELSFEPTTTDEIVSLVSGYFSLEW